MPEESTSSITPRWSVARGRIYGDLRWVVAYVGEPDNVYAPPDCALVTPDETSARWLQGVLNGEADRPSIDAAHLARQREWSLATFGPGARTHGVIDHIRKELSEIEDDPEDLSEWVDLIILAFDGAWRASWEPQQIIDAIQAKQARNEARTWPDWRTADPDRAIEHDRTVLIPRADS